jgi:hypothetical protein
MASCCCFISTILLRRLIGLEFVQDLAKVNAVGDVPVGKEFKLRHSSDSEPSQKLIAENWAGLAQCFEGVAFLIFVKETYVDFGAAKIFSRVYMCDAEKAYAGIFQA